MAINYSYPEIGALATGDLLTVVDISNGNRTNTLEIGDLSSYIITTSSLTNGSGTAAAIPKWSDADTLTDSVMSETATGISLTGDLAISRDLSVTRTSTFSDMTASAITSTTTINANNITSTGKIIANVSEYNDNADAIAGGEAVGTLYRTGDLLKIVH